MFAPEVVATLQRKYESFLPYLNERTRRVWPAVEATALGYGGTSAVAQATGLSRNTIAAGMQKLQDYQGESLASAMPEQMHRPSIPYGVYDLSCNQGWVSVRIDHDTAEFAVESIRHWWFEMGKALYPRSKHLLITADCGGSNGYRTRLWKLKLQELADEVGMSIHVCHFPPGTSKWNKIEHRMFCHITQNWRGRPLTSRQVVINLISETTTTQGLEIRAMLDENSYPTGIEVSVEEFDAIALHKARFHGDLNYEIKPRFSS